MRTVRTVAELREALRAARREERAIGLVPTMGALHDGHLALVARARATCDVVVVSLFVNPAQFDEAADLDAYPRDEARDAALLERAGVDLLFAPGADEVYPAGFATTVSVAGALTERLEGAHRGRSHFDGVATVVTKLLVAVGPDVAFFGQKDAQQLLVVRRVVADLGLPVAIEAVPTVREPDGLARSSRNVHLRNGERERALGLSRALRAAQARVAAGERSAAAVHAAAAAELPEDDGLAVEYLALVDPASLDPVERLDRPALLAVAARVGRTRLIDNALLDPGQGATP